MLRSVLVLRLAASASSLSVWRLLVSGWVWDMMRARVVPADMSAIFDDVRKGEYYNIYLEKDGYQQNLHPWSLWFYERSFKPQASEDFCR